MKDKILRLLEYVWYSLSIHMLMLGMVYLIRGEIRIWWIIFFTVPTIAYTLHKSNFHIVKGINQIKEQLNK